MEYILLGSNGIWKQIEIGKKELDCYQALQFLLSYLFYCNHSHFGKVKFNKYKQKGTLNHLGLRFGTVN